MSSIVRSNLLSQHHYAPYCGKDYCGARWPRMVFNGHQFQCACGYKTTFEPEFIEQYKAAQAKMTELYNRVKDIRDWFYPEIGNKYLYTFWTLDIKQDKEYTFDELIALFDRYKELTAV